MSLTQQQAKQLQIVCSNQEVLAAGVAKLIFATVARNEWTDSGHWGAILFVYDATSDQHLFRLLSTTSYELLFEYECYEDLQIKQLSSKLLAFEAEDVTLGLLFSDEDDASDMFMTVDEEAPRAIDALQLLVRRDELFSDDSIDSTRGINRLKRFLGMPIDESADADHLHTNFQVPNSNNALLSVLKSMGVDTNFHIALTEDGLIHVSSIPAPLKDVFRRMGIRKRDLRRKQTGHLIVSALKEAGVIQDFAVANVRSSSRTGNADNSTEKVEISSSSRASAIPENKGLHSKQKPMTEDVAPPSEPRTSTKQRRGRSSIWFRPSDLVGKQSTTPGDEADTERRTSEQSRSRISISRRVQRRASILPKQRSRNERGSITTLQQHSSQESNSSKNASGSPKKPKRGLKGALQAAMKTSRSRKGRQELKAKANEPEKSSPEVSDPPLSFLSDIREKGAEGFGLRKVSSAKRPSLIGTTAYKPPSEQTRRGRMSIVNFGDAGNAVNVMETLRNRLVTRRAALQSDSEDEPASDSDWSD